MPRSLAALLAGFRSHPTAAARRYRPLIEPLERRIVLDSTIFFDGSTLTCTGDAKFGTFGVTLASDSSLLVNGNPVYQGHVGDPERPIATKNNVTLIKLTGSPNDDGLSVDSAITIKAQLNGLGGDDILTGGGGDNTLDGGAGEDTVSQSGDVNFTIGNGSLKGMGKDSLSNVEDVDVSGGDGNNTLDASAWTLGTVSLNGGGGDDTLKGGPGRDNTLLGGDGNDTLDGGAGNDILTGGKGDDHIKGGDGTDTLLEKAGKDPVTFTLSETTVGHLAGLGNDVVSDDIEKIDLTGSPQADTFAVTNWKGKTVTLHGGGGADRLLYETNDHGKVTLAGKSDTATIKASAGSSADTEVAVDGIATATLTGATPGGTDLVIDDRGPAFPFSSLTLTDKAPGDASLAAFIGPAAGATYALNDAGLHTSYRKTDVKFQKGIDAVSLYGGAGADVFNVSGYTKDAGLHDDSGKDKLLATDDADFTLTDKYLRRTNGKGFVLLYGIADAELTGGSGDNTFTITGWTGKTKLTGGGGEDVVADSERLAGLITLTDAAITVNPYDGPNRVIRLVGVEDANLVGSSTHSTDFDVGGWTHVAQITGHKGLANSVFCRKNTNYTLTDSELSTTTTARFLLNNITSAILHGGAGSNRFTVGGWSHDATLDGAGGGDEVDAKKDADFTITEDKLTLSTGATFDLEGIENAVLTGGAGANTFTVSQWEHTATLSGGGGIDTVFDSHDDDFTLTDDALIRGDAAHIDLVGIEQAILSGGASSNRLDASAFTGKATLYGNAGNDILIGGRGADHLYGGAGKDKLKGGPSADFISGGPDADIFSATDAKSEYKDFNKKEGDKVGTV